MLLRAADVATPSLVLVGAKDRITPPTQSLATHQALQQNSPNLPHIFAEIPGAGHILHQEKPAQIAAQIRAFTGWAAANLAPILTKAPS
ncbi:MAG: pimeloyl-ACP methyl ester carboxylesterase [Paracoccaceae bacterium]